MTRSTPEGARDYLVPSRVHPGHFYALPQSPQIFKQILMISGFDRYFQIARCFRDEDLRADRQPEFTQIDLEISFPQMSTIFAVAEGFLRAAFSAAGITLSEQPFLQMTYDQAITRYGIDKPDMRLPAIADLSEVLTPELRTTLKIDPTLPVLGFTIPRVGELSGTARKALLSEIRAFFGDSGLDLLDVARLRTNAAFQPLAEAISAKLSTELLLFSNSTLTPEDLAVVITPKPGTPSSWNYDPQWIYKRVGALRLELAKKFADKHKLFEQTKTAADFKFVWVTDFPMYEWNEETKTWDAAHHPFTSPHEEDITSGALVNDKGAVRALAYDIVLRTRLRLHPYPPQRRAVRDLPLPRHVRRRSPHPLRLLPRCARIRNASPRRHRPRPRPHRDDPRRRILSARSHRLPQDRQGHRPHGRRPHHRQRPATPRTQLADRHQELTPCATARSGQFGASFS
jgi:aspartyl-tRNA synthetase